MLKSNTRPHGCEQGTDSALESSLQERRGQSECLRRAPDPAEYRE
jgi:hypothetical protein